MPVPAPVAPPALSPLDTLLMVLAPLPANLREILKEALIKGCSFEQRSKAWRLRTRVTTVDGRRQKLSIAVGRNEAFVQQIQQGVRMLREAARGPQLSPEEKAEQAARKHRQAELRRLFLKVSHGNRGLKRDVFHALIEGGLLNLSEREARQVLWTAARKVSGTRPLTAADILTISGANQPPPEDPAQKKYSAVPSDNFVPKMLGEAVALNALLLQQGQSAEASILGADSRLDGTAQPVRPMTGIGTAKEGEPI